MPMPPRPRILVVTVLLFLNDHTVSIVMGRCLPIIEARGIDYRVRILGYFRTGAGSTLDRYSKEESSLVLVA